MSSNRNISTPFQMSEKHQFNRSPVEYPKVHSHPSFSYGGNTAHSYQSSTADTRTFSFPNQPAVPLSSPASRYNIPQSQAPSSLYSPSPYNRQRYSSQLSAYHGTGASSSHCSARVNEPHVIAEHFVERDVRVPRRVIREDVVERMIVVPEKVVIEEYVEETKRVRETIIEVARPIVEEKIVEVPEYEYVERIVEVPERIIQEKIVEVPRVEIVERNVAVPRLIYEEKEVEIPVIEYREVLTEKTVEVPQIVEEIVIKEIPKPVYVDVQIPEYRDVKVDKIVNRTVPVPVEVTSQIELKVPKIRASYERIDFPVFVPRFVEVAVGAELYDQEFYDKVNSCSEMLNSMLLPGGQRNNGQATGASLSELEDVAARIQQMHLEETLNEPPNTQLAQRFERGLLDIDPYSVKSVCRSVGSSGRIVTEAVSLIAKKKKSDDEYLHSGEGLYGSDNRYNLAPSTATTATLETSLCYSGNRGADMMTLTDLDTQNAQPMIWEGRTSLPRDLTSVAPYSSLSLAQNLQQGIQQETSDSRHETNASSSDVRTRMHLLKSRSSHSSAGEDLKTEPLDSSVEMVKAPSKSKSGSHVSQDFGNSASAQSGEYPPNLDDEDSFSQREEEDQDVEEEEEERGNEYEEAEEEEPLRSESEDEGLEEEQS